MRGATVKKGQAAAERQVRAVAVCRPQVPNDSRLPSAVGGSDEEPELNFLEPEQPLLLSDDASPDTGLLRDIVLAGGVCRLPLYGYRGGADAAQLCEREVAPLLERLLAGESSAVIAYGQTGSGKSYTMGTEKFEKGQAPHPHSVGAYCSRQVFRLAEQDPSIRGLEVSFAAIEIYREGNWKERLFDLQTLDRAKIDSFEMQATWRRVAGPQELQQKLLSASFLRNCASTAANLRSSRSHAIFVVRVSFQRQGAAGAQQVKARLMLVDLAGSERASLAAAGSATQREGSGINVGLLYLSNCIRDLAEKGSTLQYRNSFLTELLKPALGGGSNEVTGGCNTLIIGCISPLEQHLQNTRSTLEFLQQAGTVKNLVRADVQQLRQQELEAQVERLQRQVKQLQLQQEQQHAAEEGSPPVAQQQAPTEEPRSEGGSEVRSDAAAAAAAAAVAAADEHIAALQAELAGVRRDLVEQRDRAEAFEELLRQQAEAAEHAAAAPASNDLSPVADIAGAAGATPMSGGRPSAAAFLAASPLLAASRGVAGWVADAAAAEAATPVGQHLPLLRLLPAAEDLCCEPESHMHPDELRVVKDKVERLLAAAEEGDDRTQAKAFGEAALYAVGALNKALGDAVTRAEEAEEDAAVRAGEFQQLLSEKVAYMRRGAAAERALTQYEAQVEELQAELVATQEALQQAQQVQQQQGTPGRLASIGRWITGSGGGGGSESRRSSHSGSPGGSPRAASLAGTGRPTQLFGSPSLGSPSRLGQVRIQAAGAERGGDAGGDRRATIAFVRRVSGGQQQEAAMAAALAAKHRKSAAALQQSVSASESGPDGLIAAARPSPAGEEQPMQQRAPEEQQEQQEARSLLEEQQQPPPQPQQEEEQQLPEPAAASPLPLQQERLQQEPQLAEQADVGDELDTPMESPEPSCIIAGGSSEHEPANAAAAEVSEEVLADAAEVQQLPAGDGAGAHVRMSPPPPQEHQLPPSATEQQQQQAGRQAEVEPEQQVKPEPGQQAEEQQQQQQQEEQQGAPEQDPPYPPLLPGPRINLWVPRSTGRGRQAPTWQEYEWEPASGSFYHPDSDNPADPLCHLVLRRGESWQRRVLLKGSSISVEQWLQRHMLAPGRCHFCCSDAPDPGCRHPEAAFAALQLCGDCHTSLDSDGWKRGETWATGGPEDPGYPWCCLCGGAGVGATADLAMCSCCKVNGFCTGCLWRFTGDDLGAVQRDDAAWECLLCRPSPLQLAYAAPKDEQGRAGDSSGSGSGGSSGGCSSGSRRGRGSGRGKGSGSSQAPPAPAEVEAATGLRRSNRARRPASQQQQRATLTPAGDDDEFFVDLSLSSPGEEAESSESDSEPEEQRRPARKRTTGAAGTKVAAGRRKPAAAAAARAAAAAAAQAAAVAPADDYSQPSASQRQQLGGAGAVRKRPRLGPNRDIASPGADGELPAHAHQRQLGIRRLALQQQMATQRQGLEDARLHQSDRLRSMMHL